MSDYSQSDTDEEMTPSPIPTIQTVFNQEPVLSDHDTNSSQETFERTFIYDSENDSEDANNHINSLTNHLVENGVIELDSENEASTGTSSEMAHDLEDALEIEPEALDYDSSSSDDPPYGANTSIQKSMAISKGRRPH